MFRRGWGQAERASSQRLVGGFSLRSAFAILALMHYDIQHHPELIDPSAWVAPGALIVGDVTLAALVSVWYGAVLRADTTPVRIGTRSNVQEGCIFHADPGYPCTVGEGVTVGHGAILHGASVADNCLIGMRATLLNGAQVGADCIVGAGALLTEQAVFPPGSLILGMPARAVRPLTAHERQIIRASAESYVQRSRAFRGG